MLMTWLDRHTACRDAREWVAAQPGATTADLVAACPRGDWLLWAATRAGYPHRHLVPIVRPAWTRAVREHLPAQFERVELRAAAATLRALPADVTAYEAVWTAYEAAWAAWEAGKMDEWRAAIDAWSAAEAAVKQMPASAAAWQAARVAIDPAAEHAQCASEVRAALPDLAGRIDAAIAAMEAK